MPDILSDQAIAHFITQGFVRVDDAFSPDTAAAIVDIIWRDIPFDRSDRATWSEPVVRLGMYSQQIFADSVNTPVLRAAFDQLAGADNWIPCRSVGTFPVRFPSRRLPDDTGKHVDAAFPGDDPADYFKWRINIRSKGRALLMLVLYSDVTVADAPTVIYKRSHADVARLLSSEGEEGLSFIELAGRLEALPEREKAYATGKAGTVYLCHPFLVHAAQAHTGDTPRFMAQAPLLLRNELNLSDAARHTPLEQSIRLALQ